MNTNRYDHTCGFVSLQGKRLMMVMGGRGDAGVVLPNVEILDVDDPFALGWQVSLLLERKTKVRSDREREME